MGAPRKIRPLVLLLLVPFPSQRLILLLLVPFPCQLLLLRQRLILLLLVPFLRQRLILLLLVPFPCQLLLLRHIGCTLGVALLMVSATVIRHSVGVATNSINGTVILAPAMCVIDINSVSRYVYE